MNNKLERMWNSDLRLRARSNPLSPWRGRR